MTGDGDKHAGIWNSSSEVVHSGMQSGPVIIFNQTQGGEEDILVISPFSRFMATSLTQTNQTLEYGVMGSMGSITPNYNHSLIVFYSADGINRGVDEWGQIMQKAYNRTNQYRLNDISINYLGYYTDNGAYYYYHTEGEQNYEQTMLDAFRQISLPFQYLQIDSWWYYKGIGDGVSEWVARPDIFPNGLPALDRKLGNISIVAHNRYWSYDTVYKQNYSFILDEKNGKALPVGNDSFWIDLFTQARQWGLTVYEQDWLITQTEEFTPLQTDLHLGDQWLMSMGQAADQLNINIQYCMSLPRHILASLQIPRVTQTRTSTDYAFHLEGKADQWAMGISSMFANALGLAPFKDVFWSTSVQPGAPYPSSPKEKNPAREIIIATLSTGPVAVGDGINYTSVGNVMSCCRADGLILKPDRPLTMINKLILDWALHESVSQGELYTTSTTMSVLFIRFFFYLSLYEFDSSFAFSDGQTFYMIVASAMKKSYMIYPSMLKMRSGAIWYPLTSGSVEVFDESNPLKIYADACPRSVVCIWYISPMWQFDSDPNSGVALIGDFDKWTAVSRQRFTSIIIDDKQSQATVTYQGVSNERVSIFIFHSYGAMVVKACFVGQNGTGWAIITSTIVTCTEMN